MISLTPVVRDDLDTLFALQVRADKKQHVAPNATSIAEFAYLTGGYVFSIRSDAKIVGLMGLIDFREHDELEDGDDPNAAFLMRMMIADTFQGQGIGKAAMQLALDWARERGNSRFQTSVVPGNDAAMLFYEGLGLRKTGRIVEDEIEMSMSLVQ
ncbi:GNAT family N-acetyltransferase [Litoreibacter roseus]|nr:GNAT family N-acetyltransferase [Litoreibacter roseus]